MGKRSLFLLLFIVIISFAVYLFYVVHTPLSDSSPSQIITIPRGMSPYRVSVHLYQNHILSHPHFFYYYLRLTSQSQFLKSGSFRLSSSMNFPQLIYQLRIQNGAANLIKITIPEGYSLTEIAELLSHKGVISDSHAFLESARQLKKTSFEFEFPFLKENPVSTLEGYLFPDTYFFKHNESVDVVLRAFLKRFNTVIVPIWDEASHNPQHSIANRYELHQILTLASIIEKEAKKTSDMPLISAVFHNRLRRNMALQSCPTVIYALGKNHKTRLYYSDLKIDSPYNTYRYLGFPPSPIGSVSRHAFYAALYPKSSAYLFFVADGNGGHIFTTNYRQHRQAQIRFQ